MRVLLRTVALFVLLSVVPVLVLRWVAPPVTAFMLLENAHPDGQLLYEWRDRAHLGDEAALAVMASEDQNFPDHFGIDLTAIEDALEDKRSGGRVRGASTITQQVAKNLFLWSGRSLVRKGLEAWFAVLIDGLWPKRRILEVYLNIVELGPGVYGVPVGARVYFDKLPADLDSGEAALLAAVLPAPGRLHVDQPSAYLRERQQWIMLQAQRLRRDGWLQKVDWAMLDGKTANGEASDG